jgi:hypothetical protein
MTKKHMRGDDGKYHIKGKTFEMLEGSRAQVWHRTAYKTPGGLTRDKLLQNKRGAIVSKKIHNTAKREKRLEQYGYFTKKGQFGFIKRSASKSKSSKKRGTRRRGSKRH